MSHKNSFIFIGAGGHAKVLLTVIKSMKSELKLVFDSDSSIKNFYDVENIVDYNPLIFPEAKVLIALGNNLIRMKKSNDILHSFGIAIDSSALVDNLINIEEGSQVMPRAVINCGTQIGKHTIINTNATIEHDCKIGDFAHIGPSATLCGGVTVGDGTLIGANATVLPGRIIGDFVTVGAGSVITKDIPNNSKVIGVPGKIF